MTQEVYRGKWEAKSGTELKNRNRPILRQMDLEVLRMTIVRVAQRVRATLTRVSAALSTSVCC